MGAPGIGGGGASGRGAGAGDPEAAWRSGLSRDPCPQQRSLLALRLGAGGGKGGNLWTPSSPPSVLCSPRPLSRLLNIHPAWGLHQPLLRGLSFHWSQAGSDPGLPSAHFLLEVSVTPGALESAL